MNRPDVLLILNGGVDSLSGAPNHDTQSRIRHGISLATDRGVERVTMVGGDASEMLAFARDLPLAKELDLSSDQSSRDTIGNAHFSKTNLIQPNGWGFEVVTADYHTDRVARNFSKVFGYSVTVHPVKTGYSDAMGRRLRRREHALGLLDSLVLAGVSPDQDELRERRITTWMPGYEGSRTKRLNTTLRQILSPR